MTRVENYDSVEMFVEENRKMLERVLRHSNNTYARACAWALIDAGSDPPDLARLERELAALQQAV